jgi:D-sedoheptulose 7-phosphate isomerase
VVTEVTTPTLAEAMRRRREAGQSLVTQAEVVARACHAMAERFHAGGRLLCFGNGGAATDAAHVAVEFVHPVIVGKRALPALSLANDPATLSGLARLHGFEEVFAAQLRVLGTGSDIALGMSPDGECANVRRGLEEAHAAGMLTVALVGGDGGAVGRSGVCDHLVVAATDDPHVAKEVHVTAYHVLWELVHVFFEQPGVLSPSVVR